MKLDFIFTYSASISLLMLRPLLPNLHVWLCFSTSISTHCFSRCHLSFLSSWPACWIVKFNEWKINMKHIWSGMLPGIASLSNIHVRKSNLEFSEPVLGFLLFAGFQAFTVIFNLLTARWIPSFSSFSPDSYQNPRNCIFIQIASFFQISVAM